MVYVVCCCAAHWYLACHGKMVFTKLFHLKGSVLLEGQMRSVSRLEIRFADYFSLGNHVDRQVAGA